MLTAIISILGGLIAASSYIVSKRKDTEEWIDKLRPYQVWIGAVLLFWSIRNLFKVLNYFDSITLLFAIVQFIVGFILAYGLLVEYIFKGSDSAKEKGSSLHTKLKQYQIPAGIGLIVLSILRLFHWL